jgi:hypothetical protein
MSRFGERGRSSPGVSPGRAALCRECPLIDEMNGPLDIVGTEGSQQEARATDWASRPGWRHAMGCSDC